MESAVWKGLLSPAKARNPATPSQCMLNGNNVKATRNYKQGIADEVLMPVHTWLNEVSIVKDRYEVAAFKLHQEVLGRSGTP